MPYTTVGISRMQMHLLQIRLWPVVAGSVEERRAGRHGCHHAPGVGVSSVAVAGLSLWCYIPPRKHGQLAVPSSGRCQRV